MNTGIEFGPQEQWYACGPLQPAAIAGTLLAALVLAPIVAVFLPSSSASRMRKLLAILLLGTASVLSVFAADRLGQAISDHLHGQGLIVCSGLERH